MSNPTNQNIQAGETVILTGITHADTKHLNGKSALVKMRLTEQNIYTGETMRMYEVLVNGRHQRVAYWEIEERG